MANRYGQLVGGVPQGSFYAAAGDVLPFKSDPYQFLLAPVGANRTFQIYVNDQARGQAVSNAQGQVLISVTLGQGDQSIVLVDTSDGSKFQAPGVTIRAYATPMAAQADVFDSLDVSLDDIEQSMALETATPNLISEVFGRPLQQPNDLGTYLTDTYRKMLFRLRQAFRLFGARLQGVRQAVFAYTGSVPFVVPHLWQPTWVLGYQLMPNGDMQTYARVTNPASMLLGFANQRVPAWVHAAFGGVSTIFPGPFTNPPVAQVLEVVFDGVWNGGTVTVFGTDTNGFSISDIFTPVSVPSTVTGTKVFQTVTNATKGAGALGTASIGLGSTRFLEIVSLGADNRLGAQNLVFSPAFGSNPDRLTWGGGPAVSIAATALPANGIITLHDQDLPAVWYGLKYQNYTLNSPILAPGITGTEHFLALEFDSRGIIVVDVGASPASAAQVATAINNALNADARYGAGYATVASAAADLAGNGTVVALACPGGGTGPVGPGDDTHVGSSIKIHPWGADAAPFVFGEPRFSALVSTVPTFRGTSLVVPAGSRLPAVVGPILLQSPILDTSGITVGGFTQPAHPGPVQLVFDGAWRAGSVRVQGTGFDGSVLTEEIAPPPGQVVFVGTHCTTEFDGRSHLFGDPAVFPLLQVGQFLQITSGPFGGGGGNTGAGGYIQYIQDLGTSGLQVVLHNTLPFNSQTAQHFVLRQDSIGKGGACFKTVTQMVNVTPQGAAPPGSTPTGTATLSVLDGERLGYRAVLGRGPRAQGAAGDVIAANWLSSPAHARYLLNVSTPSTEIQDGFLLIIGATNVNNNGLHPIVGFGSAGGAEYAGSGNRQFTIIHQNASSGGSFTTETIGGGTKVVIYSTGEILRVANYDSGTGAVTLYPPGSGYGSIAPAQAWPTNTRFELAGEMPFLVPGVAGPGTITVKVDRNAIPNASTSDSVGIFGQPVPDGYLALNQNTIADQDAVDIPGYFNPSRFTMTGTGVDNFGILINNIALDVEIPIPIVETLRGLTCQASFWMQQHISSSEPFEVDIGFDGGFGMGYTGGFGGTVQGYMIPCIPIPGGSNPTSVPNTMLNGPVPGLGGALDPTLVAGIFEVPWNAHRMVIRLRHTGVAAAGQRASVERLILSSPGTGIYLGQGTVPENAHIGAFGDVLYVWSPEQLNTAEKTALGLPQPPVTPASYPLVKGQIDRIVEAQGYWQRFDVSEYSGNVPVNLKGAYGQVAWSSATLVNMEIVVGVPSRLTVIRPAKVSLVEGEVLTITAPSNATVAETSAHEGVVRGDGASGQVSITFIGGIPGDLVQLRDPSRIFTSSMVGQAISISGADQSMNDGPFPPLHDRPAYPQDGFVIDSVSGNTVTYHNFDGVDEPSFLGQYKIQTVFPEEAFEDELLIENTGGVVLASGTGTDISISAPSNDVQTFTDPTASFPTNVVGQTLTLAGPGPNANRGDYTILSRPNLNSVTYSNPLGVSEPAFTGTYVISLAGVVGLPVPATPTVAGVSGVLPWRWLSPVTLQIASVAAGDPGNQAIFNPAATYTINYRRLTRATTAAFDLGANSLDYRWFYDAAIYLRREPGSTPFTTSEQVTFLANFQATLQNRSNGDQTQAVLTSDNGVTKTVVPVANWSFVDAQTIKIDPAVFDGTLIYTFAYTALEPEYPAPAQYLIEARSSGTSLADVDNAFWRTVQVDELAPKDRYHQVRITIHGVVDIRDIEIAGLGLRGIHLYGASPYAPGVIVP